MAGQPSYHTVNSLLVKVSDPDPDIRYMSLNDLFGILTSPGSAFLTHDSATAKKLADTLLSALDDQNGEVQNQALKWYRATRSSSSGKKAHLTRFLV